MPARKSGVLASAEKEDVIMQTGLKILKLVGKAAASAIIWVAGKLERGK